VDGAQREPGRRRNGAERFTGLAQAQDLRLLRVGGGKRPADRARREGEQKVDLLALFLAYPASAFLCAISCLQQSASSSIVRSRSSISARNLAMDLVMSP
jgi:hypothetical protein